MVLCIYTSFFDSTMGKDAKDVFIGFQNYIELWKDPIFVRSLKNTFVIVIVSVPVVCIFSLWVSALIYKLKGPILSTFRCVFYLPVVTGSVAVTVVWKWRIWEMILLTSTLFCGWGFPALSPTRGRK